MKEKKRTHHPVLGVALALKLGFGALKLPTGICIRKMIPRAVGQDECAPSHDQARVQ
jgi:hypothetical protein